MIRVIGTSYPSATAVCWRPGGLTARAAKPRRTPKRISERFCGDTLNKKKKGERMTKLSKTGSFDVEPSAVEQIIRGEAEIQAAIAQRYRRNPKESFARALAAATQTPEVAALCFYALPRGGKSIEGPSVRLAEILARDWGNIRAGSRVIEIGEKFVTAQGLAWDLENNYMFQSETRRRITDRNGKRYNDDGIQNAANAACSIAYREAVFRVIGKVAVDPIWQQCRLVSIGQSRSVKDLWAGATAYWQKAGIDESRVLAAIGKSDVGEVTQDDIVTLRGLATAIRDGETTIDQAFPPPMGETKKAFGFQPKKEVAPGPVAPDLDKMTKAELVGLCESAGVSPTGVKADLVKRLRDHANGSPVTTENALDPSPAWVSRIGKGGPSTAGVSRETPPESAADASDSISIGRSANFPGRAVGDGGQVADLPPEPVSIGLPPEPPPFDEPTVTHGTFEVETLPPPDEPSQGGFGFD